ncbi:ABC transporter ATP-binding protein [Kaistia terrae]|uniref:Spermidine/putrescine import ATP-binding protein PotA n=1 Tax=Kaistia terrae TaxID=537017 RepID=A0ABW0PRN0_9HYPH|nr:ABC transporter ATP-binding protein [Kaistia terrae]MCX5578419.1 ABC transporter ATP-binding protein [Kaistia terrae]
MALAEPLLRLRGVTKRYDGGGLVVDALDLTVERGEFLTLLGPSGSGKTTTLMMIAGFEQANAGEILYEGRSIANLPPHKRDFGVVFQSYALFPHMSVAENVAFPLTLRGIARAEIDRRVARALDMIELGGLGARRPGQLSGGQQQRVALARALVFEPKLVLMDEPLGALDKRLREQMQLEIRRLHRELGLTVVYVTHDQTEAMVMSDRVAVFHLGRVQQLADPRTIHEQPANGFVARFIGETNAFDGRLTGTGDGRDVRIDGSAGLVLRGVAGQSAPRSAYVLVSIRPERISIGDGHGENRVVGRVRQAIYFGDHLGIEVAIDGGAMVRVNLGVRGVDHAPVPDSEIVLSWRAEHTLLLEPVI